MTLRLTFLFFFFSLLLLANLQSVYACQCLQSPNPPCKGFSTSSVVFDGVVTKFEAKESKEDEEIYYHQRAEFKVLKSYKGVSTNKVFIYTGDGKSDCGFKFKVGKRYLVYAYGDNEKKLETSFCTRTREIKDSKEDIDFFATLSTLPDGVRIYGKVEKYLGNSKEEEPIENIVIQVRGKEKYELKTDSKGKYELLNLPPGNFEIKALIPENLRISKYFNSDYVGPYYYESGKDKGCIEANFLFEDRK